MNKTQLGLLFYFTVMLSSTANSQGSLGELAIDQAATEAIRAATTDEAYLTRWVDSLPEHPAIPSPRDVLGYTIGTPGELTQVDEIYHYFNALAEASDRVEVFQLGQSFEGRDMLVVAIADAQHLQNINTYSSYLEALSDPRLTDGEQAEAIIEQALPIFWMTAGLHSPELGPPEMVMELAYRLAVETREPFTTIRQNVLTLITPVFEVDGRTRQVEWFKRNIKGHTDYFNMPPRSVPFWGHYTYHDNNRDGISISQPITENYVNGVYKWKPTISLDLHESVPLLYVAGGTGPYNEGISPITIGEWQLLANYEISRLTGLGLEGVWTWGYYTGWYPGYMLWATNNHNSMGRFYETFGNGSSETMERDISNSRFAGADVTSRQWYRAAPPPEKLTWSMRNNTNYMQTGVIASLEMVARNGKMFLSNYYQKGVDALEQGTVEAPYAYLVPQEQTDPDSANYMVGALHRHAIEMQRVTSAGQYGDVEVKPGDILVKLNQPYGPLAKTLLENQSFPSDVEVPPYDDVSWTFGLIYGVDIKPIDDESVLEHAGMPFNRRDEFLAATTLPEQKEVWIISNKGQREFGPARFAMGDVEVFVSEDSFQVASFDYPAGSYLIDMRRLDLASSEQVESVLAQTRLIVNNVAVMPEVTNHELDLPRVGVYQSWTSTQNAGWVRYSLDQAKIPYTLFSKDRAREGDFLNDFDVILVPHMSGSTNLGTIIGGIDPKWSPLPYTASSESPSHGQILSSEDITGGIGFKGMAAFEEFVREGGTLVTLGSAGVIATDSGILRGINKINAGGMNTPGSIMTAKVTDHSSPLVYGYDEFTHVFRGNAPVFSLPDYDREYSPLQFGAKDFDDGSGDKNSSAKASGKSDEEESRPNPPLVLSGGIVRGADVIDGKPAIVSKPLDDGHIVLFSWNPMHRHVNHHDHAFVYNALLNWNDL